ncbi:hypothetical protein EDEG_03830 [Edhazardia aedis USNM 41457]|uniref:Uncharacterized protein n=1 Tax=Edhazardia aedis (strain USNM 41457) TaxID=1003232 RepID=J9DJV6_EDHAE|nr:hypothetical protein EDEG_03830 [Edhazardia aedis USNM 41457]|eukprot:EJW01627.1 hypothetical protein EDEG_03830 [Edhazardia aedis USNM 41457]
MLKRKTYNLCYSLKIININGCIKALFTRLITILYPFRIFYRKLGNRCHKILASYKMFQKICIFFAKVFIFFLFFFYLIIIKTLKFIHFIIKYYKKTNKMLFIANLNYLIFECIYYYDLFTQNGITFENLFNIKIKSIIS